MNNEMYSPKSKPVSDNKYMSRKDYLESMRKRAEQADGTYNTTPSKAWFQFQEENVRQHTSSSAAPIYDGDNLNDFKPVPIVRKGPTTVKAPPTANKPLKSAMKKTPSVKKQE